MSECLEERIKEVLGHLDNGDIDRETAVLDIREAVEEADSRLERLENLVWDAESFDYPHGRYKAVDVESFMEVVQDE